jgi:hypothetical protein
MVITDEIGFVGAGLYGHPRLRTDNQFFFMGTNQPGFWVRMLAPWPNVDPCFGGEAKSARTGSSKPITHMFQSTGAENGISPRAVAASVALQQYPHGPTCVKIFSRLDLD